MGCWRDFLSRLLSRGLRGVRMTVGDKAFGVVGSISEVFPEAACQRCTVYFCHNVFARVPKCKWESRRCLDVTLLDERPYWMAGLWCCRKVRKDLDSAEAIWGERKGSWERRSTRPLSVFS